MNARLPIPTALLLANADEQAEYLYLPLRELGFDDDNVRTRSSGDITELKASIAAQGVLQNLVVCSALPARKGSRNSDVTHGVIAGTRRLRALLELAKEQAIDLDYQVLCKRIPRERAAGASTAENVAREEMSTADALRAFSKMVRDGAGPETLAQEFGLSIITVQRRLKLANVSPRLFELFENNGISLDQLTALAVIDDHDRQEQVWDSAPSYNRHPSTLRRLAVGQAVDVGNDRLAKMVGMDAYVAAGGHVLRDLFAEGDGGYMSDPELVQRLAQEILEAHRQELLATGLAWADIIIEFDYEAKSKFVKLPIAKRKPTKSEAAAIAAAKQAAETAQAALDAYYDSEDEGEGEGDDDRNEEIHSKLSEASTAADAVLERLEAALQFVPDEVRARSGAVVSVDHNGGLTVALGLLRKEDQKAAVRDAQLASGESVVDASDASPKISEALCRRLTAHKTRALQVLTARTPKVAMAVLAHSMLVGVELADRAWDSPLDLSVKSRDRELKRVADDIDSCTAWAELQTLVDACQAVLPKEREQLLPWLLEQHVNTLTNIVSLCTALSLSASSGSIVPSNAEPVAAALDLDMTSWWTAGVESYLSHVPKARMADAVQEVAGAEARDELLKLKKAEAIDFGAEKLAGTKWLPAILRRSVEG